ncbi:hypothetical protein NG819_04685 [Pseudarthrobacter sp. Fe7]|nr:hypothetical protein NG819_04685 [Pseudarthrobacter sp. Fe7]
MAPEIDPIDATIGIGMAPGGGDFLPWQERDAVIATDALQVRIMADRVVVCHGQEIQPVPRCLSCQLPQ